MQVSTKSPPTPPPRPPPPPQKEPPLSSDFLTGRGDPHDHECPHSNMSPFLFPGAFARKKLGGRRGAQRTSSQGQYAVPRRGAQVRVITSGVRGRTMLRLRCEEGPEARMLARIQNLRGAGRDPSSNPNFYCKKITLWREVEKDATTTK